MLKTSGCNQHLFRRVVQETLKSSHVANNTSFHPTQRHMSPPKGTCQVCVGGSGSVAGFFFPMSMSTNEREDKIADRGESI